MKERRKGEEGEEGEGVGEKASIEVLEKEREKGKEEGDQGGEEEVGKGDRFFLWAVGSWVCFVKTDLRVAG